ncbi:branched-chain amino acid transport system ATP-binding protein [Paraburkholderia atlantica]|uniref:ABC transporter related protein n=1 Tax=Paraburkholderia atlantica TaxID=2654982 RepID=D5WKT4_PARAM|nr:ABC transporter ATP-binding protein [Paraburkholderia atlantica]ADG19830.1 ABC transporter related protein [Paraburkholderia atlantica]MBB5414955.1 branched-chain amino acid transport system ATP-binding protein [Paraburkholderia atlantica]MBB5423761.1 branched-chain amino acid transport system ATP-binding protein [Paraburkholderia atlantica]MPW04989.1 ATP-binding cassette domain-containing protein [Paraburkholderia atlantica]NUY29453.1 ABC transporter ATP-binding protein [Paraburkholderia a
MLSVKNLHAGYGKVKVLHGISIDVPKGSVVTLIGSNGAGKTTTMRAISGMIRPSDGEITMGVGASAKRIDALDSHRIARLGLAHSPEGRRVFATMSVHDNLILGAFPRLTWARPRGDVNADLERAIELFPRLKERRHQLAGTLSGGEQQMLAMARAIMLNPELVLLDEPSMGLAPILVEEVFRIIENLKGQGVTMLLVEQFAAAALNVADYGYVLENGRIAAHGPALQLRNDPSVKAAYLGTSH